MVSEIFPVVASEKFITQHLASRSMISKRQLPVWPTIVRYTLHDTGLIHYSEVHTAQLGDLVKDRYKMIHTTIN